MLDERKAQVLRALVDCYIRTGEPVSSRAVLDRTGLGVSSATIRNDIASLEGEGFCMQPHTSAGRVPTAAAYRYYVDHLSPRKLRAESLTRIHDFFGTVHHELSLLLKQTSEMLADVSNYPALVVGPGLRGEVLRGVHLVPLGSQSALIIIVSDAGRVSQELVRFDAPVTPEDLNLAERVLAKHLKGQLVAELEVMADEVLTDVSPSVAGVLEAIFVSTQPEGESTQELYLGGTNRMAALWDDLAKVQQILELMSQEAELLGIIAGSPDGTSIRIGAEMDLPAEVDVAMVSTDYEAAEGISGRVGVIGPMRMDYRRAISIVEEVSDGLSEQLGSQP
ncbi:MAG: heat-inducible transcriptional repressor HrcA [Acidimicrobiia bacterium]